jgi:tight adherence protein B
VTSGLFLTNAYKLGACALLAIAVFLAVLSALLDVTGPLARAWRRYVTLLDRRLKELFLPGSGQRIATLQAVSLTLLGALVFSVDIPYWYLLLLAAALGPLYHLERRKRQRKQELEKQLDPFILALANALKSIPSVSAAFQSVAETSPSPMREEIELANREMHVGSTLDEALLHLSVRIGSQRLDSALAAVVLGRQIGGNLPRVLESTASSIREMSRLEGVLRTKTSEAKMQLYAIGAAPFFLVLGLSYVSPGYFDPLQQSGLGYMVGLGAVAAWVLALYLARQVLSVSL